MELSENVYSILPGVVAGRLRKCEFSEELRLRAGMPSEIYGQNASEFFDYIPNKNDLRELIAKACNYSLFAHSDEISKGYITLKGGHRLGFCGRASCDESGIIKIDNFSSVNLRFARQIVGCSEPLIRHIIRNKKVLSALILSPPGVGKTTVLRDISRRLSTPLENISYKVALIDERGELAAMENGAPCLEIGQRCDVLSGAPKKEAFMLFIRCMSPEVIVTDELGSADEFLAASEAVSCGVSIIASAHAGTKEELIQKASLWGYFKYGLFDRYIFIQRNEKGVFVRQILDKNMQEVRIY